MGLDGRAAGPLTMVLLAVGGWAMASVVRGAIIPRRSRGLRELEQDQAGWQDLTLVPAAMVPAATAWACLSPEIAPPWLQRFVILLADAAGCVAVFGSLRNWRPEFARAKRFKSWQG